MNPDSRNDQHLKPKFESQSSSLIVSPVGDTVASERLHFSCPHCDKSYYTFETEFNLSNQVSAQIFSCTHCDNDFIVEFEEAKFDEISNLNFQRADLDFIHSPNFDVVIAKSSSQTLETSTASSKNLKIFLFDVFKQSLQFKYLPFYLALICFILGLSFAHMRNAIGLSAVLLLLQIAFSSIFKTND